MVQYRNSFGLPQKWLQSPLGPTKKTIDTSTGNMDLTLRGKWGKP